MTGSSSRRAGFSTMLGGVFWIIAGRYELEPTKNALLPGTTWYLMLPALLLLLVGLRGVYMHWSASAGLHGRVGMVISTLGILLALVSIGYPPFAGNAAVPTAWPIVTFAAGLIGLNTGLLLLSAATMRATSESGWQALPLLVGLIGLFLPLGGGVSGLPGLIAWIVFGLGWVWLGYMLCTEQAAPRLAALRIPRR